MNTHPRLNRREFLLTTAAAALGAGCATNPPHASRWQVGCYTRPWDQHPYPVALDAIAEAGYEYVGLMTAKGKSWVMITADTTREEAAAMGAALRQRGLKAASVYGDYKAGLVVADNVKALHTLIEHAVACGSPDLLLGGVGEDQLQAPYYESIRQVCDFAAAHGVRLTIKPHGGQIATGPQCRRKIEAVGHSNFRLWYDPGNIFYYSDGALDPVAEAATVDGLVAGMSVKDFLPPKQVEVTPGTGRVNFPGVMARLQQGGFRGGPLVVECVARPDPANVPAITAEAKRARALVISLIGAPDASRPIR